jgi:hypothetical protein
MNRVEYHRRTPEMKTRIKRVGDQDNSLKNGDEDQDK